MTRAETLEQEKRWALPVALATLLAVGLIATAPIVSPVSGDGAAEVLRAVEENRGAETLSGLMQALAFALLTLPLVYLFRAARARSPQVRSQLIGLVIAAPLFLALSSGLAIVAQQEAADEFVNGQVQPSLTQREAKDDCAEEREDEGGDFLADEYEPGKGESPLRACETRKLEDDAATDARTEAAMTPFATGFGLAGGLGFAITLFYTCLWAMRTGLLSRFWGSLGMALGVVTLLGLILFALVWFIYFALLVAGKVPGGKPPAWQSGEAEPWPTPGEKAAAEMEPEEGWDASEGVEGEEPEERRKRKQRE